MAQHAEVQRNGSTDEKEQQQQELALLFQISGTSLEDDVANLQHRLVGPQLTNLAELPEAEQQSEYHDGETPVEDACV